MREDDSTKFFREQGIATTVKRIRPQRFKEAVERRYHTSTIIENVLPVRPARLIETQIIMSGKAKVLKIAKKFRRSFGRSLEANTAV